MLSSLPKSNECVFVTMLRLVVQLRNGVRVLIFLFFYCIKICHLFIFLNFIFDSEEAQVYGVS